MTAPVDPRADRQRALIAFLRAAIAATFALATASLLPGDAGRVARGAMLVVLLATPLVRALWLAVRWARKGDHRYALVALTVTLIAGAGAVVA